MKRESIYTYSQKQITINVSPSLLVKICSKNFNYIITGNNTQLIILVLFQFDDNVPIKILNQVIV